MSQILYYLDVGTLENGAESGTSVMSDDYRIKNAASHQVTVKPATSATGTVKIAIVAIGLPLAIDTIELLKDGLGADIEIDLADGVQSVTFEAAVSLIGVVATATLAEGCDVSIAGW